MDRRPHDSSGIPHRGKVQEAGRVILEVILNNGGRSFPVKFLALFADILNMEYYNRSPGRDQGS